ncbi:MAG TPA: hypothetical protein VJH69_03150 [Candidatus Paceibacterota bacterium]|uniref:Uncharacterized protein n=1 Tax=Candidatus Ryanbacteria bacterium RIFCSPHIGHO2_01_FULL_45_22 TaxID=1802114 RepID=A0A1G2G1N6_9BACT|nr:MAG: hypothetical protein A2719_00215 [Candidatus Ryanbacteria bacterium RIFCSPHIGHO2_01_FULL_45_22]
MSNLLPKETNQLIWKRFTNRLLFVGALMFLLSALFVVLALLPSYIIPRIEQNILKKSESTLSVNGESDPVAEKNELSRSRDILLRATPAISASSSPSDLISAALSRRPQGIYVNRISFTAGRDGTMIIAGDATGREELNQYREELSKDERFTAVSIPVGSLIEAKGGEFTITLKGLF